MQRQETAAWTFNAGAPILPSLDITLTFQIFYYLCCSLIRDIVFFIQR